VPCDQLSQSHRSAPVNYFLSRDARCASSSGRDIIADGTLVFFKRPTSHSLGRARVSYVEYTSVFSFCRLRSLLPNFTVHFTADLVRHPACRE
jgi:hypothetical protein